MRSDETERRDPGPVGLSRRERQIMDVVFRLGEATAADVHFRMPDPPTYTTVRGLLRVLVDKGHLEVRKEAVPYVYRPTTPRDAAGTTVLSHVVRTFFGGSAVRAMAALLGSSEIRLTQAELDRLSRIVAEARDAEEGS
ncbi:MAG: BlaI/MecI/CopY family transcriptional regulator [Longimicrobiaceae bacterium]